MKLFENKKSNELQDNIIEIINKYRKDLTAKTKAENSMKAWSGQSKLGLGMTGLSTITSFSGIIAVSAGVMVGSTGGLMFVAGLSGATVGLAYAGITKMISLYNEKRFNDIEKNNQYEYKVDQSFENKLKKSIENSTVLDQGLNIEQMDMLKNSIKGKNTLSVDEALTELKLPTTQKTLFKNKVADTLAENLESSIPKSFYSSRKESIKTGIGLTVAASGIAATVGAISAASIPVAGFGVIAAVGGLGWSGIRMVAEAYENMKLKREFEQKNKLTDKLNFKQSTLKPS